MHFSCAFNNAGINYNDLAEGLIEADDFNNRLSSILRHEDANFIKKILVASLRKGVNRELTNEESQLLEEWMEERIGQLMNEYGEGEEDEEDDEDEEGEEVEEAEDATEAKETAETDELVKQTSKRGQVEPEQSAPKKLKATNQT